MSDPPLHALLLRQLRRVGVGEHSPPTLPEWAAVLARVSRTYSDTDQDRYTMERSLSISSREMRDLNEGLRRSAETQLAVEHAKLQQSLAVSRATHEAAPDGTVVIGGDQRVISFNRRFAEMWGVGDAALGSPDATLLGCIQKQLADPEEMVGRLRYLDEHSTASSNEECALLDGRVLDRYSAPIFSENGTPLGRVWFFRDITEKRRIEGQLRTLNGELERRVAERTSALAAANVELAASFEVLRETQARLVVSDSMASLGTLAAGVAHEINNPLAYITANLEMIAEDLRALPPSSSLKELVDMAAQAKEGAERVRKIVRGLKAFSRADEEQRRPIDLRPVLEQSISMTFNEIKHRARLETEFLEVPFVEADAARLGQVFINLLVNAAHAIPEGRAHENTIQVVTRTDAIGRAVVEVRDTGPGISPELLGRIFDPFFTTKPVGVGTGLGLAICRGIVTGLGGELTVASVLGEGAVFRVLLKPASLALAGNVGAIAAFPGVGLPARVLIVDDDPGVLLALRRLLKGHHVTVANNGRQALDFVRSGAEFDVILCDLMMPEMTGMELHAEISRTLPNMVDRIVFLTGGAFSSAARSFLDRVPNERLDKPFEAEGVRAVVQRFAR